MDTATTEIYTLSLHDALPISRCSLRKRSPPSSASSVSASCSAATKARAASPSSAEPSESTADRKSTRLNSSHEWISYAVFCLKKKKESSIEDTPGQQP